MKRKGFTLIEVIIDAFIITAVFAAIVSAFILTLQTINAGRMRTIAVSVANEHMERLRTLPYDSLATRHGTILPQGDIPDVQEITRDGISYTVNTTIIFVDDPLDGCAIPVPNTASFVCTDEQRVATQDLVPVDYKRLTVQVRRTGQSLILANLSTNVAARAAETPTNTGMLLVTVNNARGQPVAGATVEVIHTGFNIRIVALTNLLGYVFIANLPPDRHNGYQIITTKDRFSTDRTTERTPNNPNQIQPNVDIFAQQITSQTLAIDLLSTLVVEAVSEQGSPMANLTITATGEKITQFNPVVAKNVFNGQTDATGFLRFENIEWDSYRFSLPQNFFLVSVSPYQPVSLDPDTTTNVRLVITTDRDWPRITAVSPTSATIGSTVALVIEGENFTSNSTVILRRAGQNDIIPASLNVSGNRREIEATFNFVLFGPEVIGQWDIVINSNGRTIIQREGLTIS